MVKEFLQRLVFHSGIIKPLFFRKSYETLFKVAKQLKKFVFAIINDGIKCFMTHVYTMVDYRQNTRFPLGLDVEHVWTNN